MNTEIDLLKEIKPVEAPPFLLTRIEHKIKSIQKDTLQPKWVITAAFSLFLLLTVNFVAIKKYKIYNVHSSSDQMNLYPDNLLYR